MKISQTKFQNLENLFPLFFSPPPRQESIYIALREIMSLFIRNLVNSCQSRPYNISFSTIQTWYRKKNLYSKKSRTKISVKHPSNISLSLFLFLQRETNKKWEGQTKNGRGNNGRKRERSFETWETGFWESSFRRSATIASFQLLDSGRFLSGIKMENARLISKLARSFGSFLRDVRGK